MGMYKFLLGIVVCRPEFLIHVVQMYTHVVYNVSIIICYVFIRIKKILFPLIPQHTQYCFVTHANFK